MIWWIGGFLAPLVGLLLARNLSNKGYYFWRSFLLGTAVTFVLIVMIYNKIFK